MDAPHVAVEPFIGELTALHGQAAREPGAAPAGLGALGAACRSFVARLVDAPASDAPPDTEATWFATRTPDIAMVVGPGMILLADRTTDAVSLTIDGRMWSFARDDTGAFVSLTDDAGSRTWDLLADGAVRERDDARALEARLAAAREEATRSAEADDLAAFARAEEQGMAETRRRAEERARAEEDRRAGERSRVEESVRATTPAPTTATPAPAATTPVAEPVGPWRATHRVGPHPLDVGGVPEGTLTPGTVLVPGLPVRLIGTTSAGWALVECSNTWRCYVAAWGIEPAEGGPGG